MLTDARELPEGHVVDTDVCVIGAGPAGIAVALRLAEAGCDVVVLESGGPGASAPADALSLPGAASTPAAELTSRARGLGGSTAKWGGNSAPLDPIDFEVRPWVARSGWPIAGDTLRPWAKDVDTLCGLERPPPSPPAALVGLPHKPFRRARRHFGEAHRPALAASPRCAAYVHATVVALQRDGDAGRVGEITVATTDASRRWTVRPRRVVLAAGIETPRLLLASGLGNDRDLVGRCFIKHVNAVTGLVALAPGIDATPYVLPVDAADTDIAAAGPGVLGLRLTPERQRDGLLLNHVAFLVPLTDLTITGLGPYGRQLLRAGRAAATALPSLLTAWRRGRLFGLRTFGEQRPELANRLRLATHERDALGVPRLVAEWRVGEAEHATALAAIADLDGALRRRRAGRALPLLPAAPQAACPALQRGSHFMGTTRMAAHPGAGVVDADCKVFGLDNVWVAGASVMPTGGASMVTWTVLCLALRLADHLTQRPAG